MMAPLSSVVEILGPREVPLGGMRAMTVRRTLPSRERTTVGAWCFVDHYGPDDVQMVVPPHPHTGLQTVSWLFTGEVEHRDSAGHHALVRPGEVNLMTAGRGISHSEYSTPGTGVLHGAQLWVVLPDADRDAAPAFEHHVPEPVSGPGWEARVFVGSLLGRTSPVRTFTPLVGVEISLDGELDLDVDPAYEWGVLADTGEVSVEGREVRPGALAYVAPGAATLGLAGAGARVLLLGGAPFDEQIVMWWNFIGRSHDEVVAFREEWQRLLEAGRADLFALPGPDTGEDGEPIPAPPLPNVRLRVR